MSCAGLLVQLHNLGARLWLEDGSLRISAPRGVLTEELRVELKTHRDEILEWLKRQDEPKQARAPLVRQVRPQRLPLSYAQQRLWFLYRLEGPGAAYNIPLVLRLEGDLDASALQQSLADIVARHEVLRTVFREHDSIPCQCILPVDEASLDFTVRNISESQLAGELAAAAAASFELERELPLRAWLFCLGPQTHVLLLLLHHIAGDGSSMRPLARDLEHAYRARSRDEAPRFADLPVQYADYTLWQRELLGDENNAASLMARQMKFWRKALADVPEELNLPVDRPRPLRTSYRGASIPIWLDRELHQELVQLAQHTEASLFMVLQAGLAALLACMGAGEDIPIGTVAAGRSEEALEDLAGFFVSTLVLRADVSGSPGFIELVKRVRAFALDAYSNQHVPFERLVEALQPARSQSRHPLFQVMLVLQNVSEARLDLPGIVARPEPLPETVAKFDLTFDFSEQSNAAGTPQGIDGRLEYSLDLFDRETAEAMASRFVLLLRKVVAAPDAPLRQIDLLTPHERYMLLEEFNASTGSIPQTTLMALFEAQVARSPNAIALIWDQESVTYAGLNRQSNRLAHYLIGAGIQPGALVGIALERSVQMVVAILATLKAGAAYLPLDPEYPPARLAYMLADAAPVIVLSTTALSGSLPENTRVIALDSSDVERELENTPAHDPGTLPTPQHPAYVIYTSGSTGAPKGVVITHANVTRLFAATQHWFQFGPQDVWTLFHSYAFDFSVWELWGPLLHGGRLVIIPKSVTRSPLEFLQVLVARQVTVLNQTPSAFYQLIQAEAENPELGNQLALRVIVFGGEALDLRRLAEWYERHPENAPRLVNMYGITETTVHVTYAALTPEMAHSNAGSMIGSNIPDLRIYVLNEYLQPVPVGVVGEIYVAGAGLAQGYRNRQVLTSERFVADPYGLPGVRMYRTGDLARRRRTGELEFLGRADQQVKIRGFRIELGEIEAELKAQDKVAQAMVVARDDGPDGKQLVAYIVPVHGNTVEAATLRHGLAERLPEYMVPAAFVMLDALPLTPSGKLDRRALPAPELRSAGYCPPRTPQEEILCAVFAEVLGVDRVGLHDNFFHLGGHSLLAARLASKVRSALGVEVAIRTLFESPTVAELAARLSQARQANLPLVRQARPVRLPLSYAQQRLWFLYRMEGPSATYNIPLALRLHGELHAGALEQALADVVARHEVLRTIFPEHNGIPYQHILPVADARPSFIVETVTESELTERLAAAAATGMELQQELLLRTWLFHLGPQTHVLLFLLHHIAGDGWSMEPLARDIERAYQARSQGHAPDFKELPVQYGDYTLWQRELMGTESNTESLLARQMEFWRKVLAGAPEELNLPADRPRPATSSYRGAIVPVRVEPALHQALLKLARQSGASLFMVLHAGLAALLSRMGAGEDILIGTVVAGRNESALEDMVGFFVNSLAMRTDVSGNPAFVELITRVRGFALEAYEHQDIPFERLVEVLQPVRSMSRHPLFQVVLALQNAPAANLNLMALEISAQPLPETVAKFDLTLNLGEQVGENGELQGIEGYLEYSLDLFDRATAESLVARLLRLLERAAAAPHVPLHQLEILTAQERRMLLEEFNIQGQPAPATTIIALFEAQVAREPDAIAVTCEGVSLSYIELSEQANRLAHFLAGLGIAPGAIVGIALERSAAMVVAIVAVLKAGAAYLPLDPGYPQARLAHMLTDAAPAVVLSSDALPDLLPPDLLPPDLLSEGIKVIALDAPEIERALSQLPNHNPIVSLSPQHPAYVIYTSGSTGVPKGVVVTHYNVVRLFAATHPWFSFGPQDVWTLFHSYAFDFSVWELWGPLLHGGRLVVVPKTITRSPAEFLKLLAEEKVTVLNQTPSAFYQLLQAGEEIPELEGRLSLRSIIFGGEALDLSRLKAWYERHPEDSPLLVNMYGITETTVHVSYVALRKEMALAGGSLIGGNIPDLRVYVLDGHLQLLPEGVAGETYVAGAGLAQGYLNRPELTSARFVADPYGKPGARMYRTGDLARWRAAGMLEYLGRADQQVKIRGFRIELGEIESALKEQPVVAQAAVVVREDGAEGRQLVAYVVPVAGVTLNVAELRDSLGKRLPDYMVPSAFVQLDLLPLTANGKLDRRALPAPELRSEDYYAPRTPQEEILCTVFAEVLGLERVGIHDNFFELGGHSLLAARLVSHVRSSLGVELPVRAFFEAPRVAELVERLDEAKQARMPLVRQKRPEPLPLSYAQQRLWFLHRMEGPNPTYNIPVAVQLEGELDAVALQDALSDLVERHESLRTIFPEQDGVPRQQVLTIQEAHPRLIVEHTVESQLRERMAEAAAVGIDLEQELPVKAWLFSPGPRKHVLMFVLHHIAGDGWSLAPLANDLQQAYKARLQGQSPQFAELPVQYADYTLWQRDLLGDENDAESLMARQMEFWRKALAGAPEEINLPADRSRAALASHRGAALPVWLNADLHRDLMALARSCGATLFMVFQAGVAALLSRLGAGNDIPMGTVVAGRGEKNLEGLIGFFVNTLVMRADVSDDPNFAELVKRVRGFSLDAYAHQDVPFERLVENLQPARSMARHPLFQVMLVLQNAPEADLDQRWLAVEVEPSSGRLAKYDLNLSLGERPGPEQGPRGIEGYMEYSLDLFDHATAENIIQRLVRLLKHAIAAPNVPLHSLDVLAEEERHMLLEKFNATDRLCPLATIPELFERHAARTPQAIAVMLGAESMTYQDLNERSNRLAHFLAGLGAGPEALVGIALERSMEMIVAIMGVLKAGAAYLPLDPEYPQARLAYMLNDAAPAAVLTTSKLASRLPQTENIRMCNLDTPQMEQALHLAAAHNPGKMSLAHHPAYVIYTSGSTGVPKGVVVTHVGIPSMALEQVERLNISPGSRVLQFASLNFDASLWEIVMALTSGAALVLVRDERSGAALRDLLVAQGVTHALLPLGVLATLEECGKLPLEYLINGGEALPAEVVARWSPGCRLVNAYGPTETTVFATMSTPLSGAAVPPIGSPIFNTRAYVLDSNLEPVPVGVAGELYALGLSLARGYLGRPALTAERFVAAPYGGQPGARMYRTGDLARWRSDGMLDYLGRSDQQIKLRGFRIELGEVESALRSLPQVAQAAVIVRDDLPGGRQLVGYLVPAGGATVESATLRSILSERLPGYMVPAAFVTLNSFPLLPNGKLDRKVLPSPVLRSASDVFVPPNSGLERAIAGVWKEVLHVSDLGVHDNFFDLGGHSLLLAQVHAKLQKILQVKLPMVKLFEYSTIAALANYLELRLASAVPEAVIPGRKRRSAKRAGRQSSEIAIIGMACRFPGAPSVEAFWNNLKHGIESISSLSQEELASLPGNLVTDQNFVNASGRLSDVDLFDPTFFGLTPAEATATDPQQRLMLECAWEAMESAGYAPQGQAIGVFAGAGESLYRDLLRSDQNLLESLGDLQLTIGTGKDHLAPRISYLLNLRGPSVPVNTACSTSLVAVHLACQSLINCECDMALAGGVALGSQTGYLYQESSILSPDGHCRAFDASAQGTVPGSGAGAVLLKRLEDALADGDHIHAVIKGSAINNDGNAKVGYTAPSVEGQKEVIEQALEVAGAKPEQISCIEAHGTGTPLGDPIEIEALRQVFRNGAGHLKPGTCALGSVKTNIGHCDSAAGVAGLIKAVLCLENRTLVPSLHFERPNPQLDLDHSPFYVSTQTTPWEHHPRLAGVSSFGIGGTNAHVVLAEAPEVTPSGPSRSCHVFTLSAHTETALERRKADLARFLHEHPAAQLADVAFTLNQGRKVFPVRQSFVCRNREEALAALAGSKHKPVRDDPDASHSVVFLFPGQGKAYAELGQGLYREEACFREEVDRCCTRLSPLLGADLRDLVFAREGALPEQVYRPLFWQPALFVVEYALAQLWISWGVKPAAMIGHSLGEYVAATVAGVLELDDALALVAERARGTETLEAGAMLAVPVGEDKISSYIKDRVSLAAVNAPELCVLAGPTSEIDRLAEELALLNPIRLEASHAFHSPLVEPLMGPLTSLVSKFKLSLPRIPYLSNVSGTWIRDEEATDPAYWARHLREPVRFHDCLEEVERKPGRILLEVGPGKVLSDLARRSSNNVVAFPSLRTGDSDGLALAEALGGLWSAGAPIEWQKYYQGEKRRRVALPTYPFERRSYWATTPGDQLSLATSISSLETRAALGAKDAPENWLYVSTWKRTRLGSNIRLEDDLATPHHWLIFAGETGVGASLAERLRHSGQSVSEVRRGAAFHGNEDGSFSIDPNDARGYGALFAALREAGNLPQRIICAWGAEGARQDSLEDFDSLIYLAQALGMLEGGDAVRLAVLTSNIHRVLDEDLSHPAQAALLGVIHVLPKENPRVVCQEIDLDSLEDKAAAQLVESILGEFTVESPEAIVAYRRRQRWSPVVDHLNATPVLYGSPFSKGVCLVTHALQELGMALAARLAEDHHAHVVLMDRTFFPKPEDWDAWIADQGENDPVSRKIFRLRSIRGSVRVVSADFANRSRVAGIKAEIELELGPVTGIFHLEKASKTGLIQGKSSPPASVLRTELAELEVLEEVFAGAEFRILFSSNLAESGGLGQVEQAARNAVINLFSERLGGRGQKTVAIELGTRGWSEADENNPDRGSFIYQQLEEKRKLFGMALEECLDAMERAAGLGLPGVIVSTRDFSALMEQQRLFTADFFQQQIDTSASRNGASAGDGYSRPDISTPYEPPRNEVEKLLVEIWKAAFRFQEVGVHDNFFELGGHSLLAIQFLKNMNETFASRLALKDLFDSPTIAQLASLISGAPADGEDALELEALLAEIEGMPEEKLRAELNSSPEQTRSQAAHD